MSRTLRRNDWVRFDYYAHHVRHIIYSDAGLGRATCIFEERAWPGSLLHRSGLGLSRSLTPNLMSLTWQTSYPESVLNGLCHFISPHLRTLKVILDDDGVLAELPTLIEELEHCSPPIKDLTWHFPDSITSETIPAISHHIGHAVRKFLQVERLSLNKEVFQRILRDLNPLCNLKTIELDQCPPFDFEAAPYNFGGLTSLLPSLESVDCNDIPFSVDFLPHFGGKLKNIYINHFLQNADETNTESFRRIVHIIGGSCPALTTLTLRYLEFSGHASELKGALGPLLRCPLIKDIHVTMVDIDFAEAISDDDIVGMTVAWPALESIVIAGPGGKPPAWPTLSLTPQLPSLNALTTLICGCPDLHTIVLSVDTSRALLLHDEASVEWQNNSLAYLNLNHSLIESVEPLAVWLALFCNDEVETYLEKWPKKIPSNRQRLWQKAHSRAENLRRDDGKLMIKIRRQKKLVVEEMKKILSEGR
jgi:hypothetical protein